MDGQASFRVAIVGSGPAGIYAAAHLLEQHDRSIGVDVFERLPTPWGLVRGGVAPDHPEKKRIARMFERTACHPNFRFFGNVDVGRALPVEALRQRYDAVVLAYGATLHRSAGIEGEALPGCICASDFVGWYNGHPDHADLQFDLTGNSAVVVGNGNVALDLARVLTLPRDRLLATDIAPHALSALDRSHIREVTILGRRGALQASFNNPELEELGHLPGVDIVVDPEDLPSQAEIDAVSPDWTTRRKLATLQRYAAQRRRHERCIKLRFLSIPRAVLGEDHCTGLSVERNQAVIADGKLAFEPTGKTVSMATRHIFWAIGFRGEPIEDVPFDPARGVIPNAAGRVTGSDMHGLYTCGWIARGPSGVIGTNKICAKRAVDAVITDLKRLAPDRPAARQDSIDDYLVAHHHDIVSYGEWQNIEEVERAASADGLAPCRKLVSWTALLDAAHAGPATTFQGLSGDFRISG